MLSLPPVPPLVNTLSYYSTAIYRLLNREQMFKAFDPVLDELTVSWPVDWGTSNRHTNNYNPGQCEIKYTNQSYKPTVPGIQRIVPLLLMTKEGKLEKEQNELCHKWWVRLWQNDCCQENEEDFLAEGTVRTEVQPWEELAAQTQKGRGWGT